MTETRNKNYMNEALSLARRGGGFVNPNPQVGAVVVRDGEIVGKGYHEKFGAPHAEVRALEDAGTKAEGSTMYVTLEPCVHYGKTPPCTDAIIESGITRVYVAMKDPNSKVSGKGVDRLKEAGVEVFLGLMKEEAESVNEIYLHYVETGRPFVLLKLAMTMDGKIATKTGDSRWISSGPSRELVHELRARYSGVLVGVNTVISDDPRLNVRKAEGPDGTRFVLDTDGRTPPDARLLDLESSAPTVIATGEGVSYGEVESLKEAGAEIWPLPASHGRIDLIDLLEKMGSSGYDSLLVEGGGEVAWDFLSQGLVDKVRFFYSPKIAGGEKAIPAVSGSGVEKIDQGIRLKKYSVSRIGEDFSVVGYPVQK
ncbi:bifunctional diaminohydroxyphosphoribosylaminopyrimidine deaminase/5-amino-6-(5-phosphoribosylamino)uracil reductase RibD [Candidatus Bipolaricaulota bacterium]|nr:bifunctional diaminohydroxyphosphoribosylaminopyrimidine deaminase/5-amino-6-(5-phosphoribosylamino)uracil reductase RibD [Candidatus Bipolaricaulota bacterium]